MDELIRGCGHEVNSEGTMNVKVNEAGNAIGIWLAVGRSKFWLTIFQGDFIGIPPLGTGGLGDDGHLCASISSGVFDNMSVKFEHGEFGEEFLGGESGFGGDRFEGDGFGA